MTHYEIYQPKEPTFRVDENQKDYNREDYKNVYAEFLMEDDGGDYKILEKLFEMFNIRRPQNYDGRSMSVGDIVALKDHWADQEEKPRYYICDSFGWNKINLA